jgi:kynureninase
MHEVEAKSRALTGLFVDGVQARCFAHPHGYAVIQCLIEQNVIGDFRAPT